MWEADCVGVSNEIDELGMLLGKQIVSALNERLCINERDAVKPRMMEMGLKVPSASRGKQQGG